MTDDQLAAILGDQDVETFWAFRDLLKSQLTPLEYQQMMTEYKSVVLTKMLNTPGASAVDAADQLIDQLEANTEIDDEQRELTKALIVLAAFDMQPITL